MSTEKTFLLGVGAQKAASTWLHRYLNAMDCANFGRLDEYHIFDALYIPECANFIIPDYLYLKTTYWRIKSQLKGVIPINYFRRRMQTNTRHYFDYFESLLRAEDGIQLTGDITPSYSGLPAAAYEKIRQGFEERDIRLKTVFIMRDPLERCWSAVRMYRIMSYKGEVSCDPNEPEEDALRAYYSGDQAAVRTNYHHTIKNLEAALAREDIHYAFFENLFNEKEVSRLADFVGVEYAPVDFKKKMNETTKDEEAISLELKREIAQHFRPVYEFVATKFAGRNVEDLWEGYKHL